MDTNSLVARLLIDGAVIVPDVLSPDELASAREAFERHAAARGKRQFAWDELCMVPELVALICHPRLMAVVEGMISYQNEEVVFANCSGARDAHNPERPFTPFDPNDLRHGPIGWHDDVQGMKTPKAAIMNNSLTTLIYLDETFADQGAYCSAEGSHHLGRSDKNGRAIVSNKDLVLDNCHLRALPLKAGSAIVHRAHEWHGVMPIKTRRRIMLQTFVAKSTYDVQDGHTQVSEAAKALIPADRHRYLHWYKQA
jgi:hypothetical protein